MIELINIGKSFDHGKTWIIKDISLQVNPGETLVLLGASGAGKSTLLKTINKLIYPSFGEVRIDNKNINDIDVIQLRRKIGYVFQNVGLFSHMTVRENISIILKLMKVPKNERIKIVNDLLNLVGMPHSTYQNRYPSELSGGEQQRIGVARALSTNPDYILMDEPFCSLDAYNREGLQQTILQLKKEIKKTILFVTHDIGEAIRLGDKIAIIHNGKLEQIGSPHELIHQSDTTFVKQFFQNFIKQTRVIGEYIF